MSLSVIIPAAGLSRRMGVPKLVLPLGEKTVIARLLGILERQEISHRIVVCRKSDEALRSEVVASGATCIQPEQDPSEMKESVRIGLQFCETLSQNSASAGWMLIPGDHPLLGRSVLDRLLGAWKSSTADVLLPTYGGKRGHPAIFRWETRTRIREIPSDRGLDWLVKQGGLNVQELPVSDSGVIQDMDTPEDYRRIVEMLQSD